MGLRKDRLEAFARHVGGNGCVVRSGWMAYHWGMPDKTVAVASAGKPVVAHFIYRAVDLGLLSGLDERVAVREPGLKEINAALGHKDADITWRHLVQQTACYGSANAPGTAFDYNDYQMALLWRVLMRKVYRASMETLNRRVMLKHLTHRVGMEDRPCFIKGTPLTCGGQLKISARDFCRFGLLYSRGGVWRDSQEPALAAHWAEEILHSPVPETLPKAGGTAEMMPGEVSYGGGTQQEEGNGSYSHMWWLNGHDASGGRFFPDLPHDVFAAIGQGGTHLMAHFPSTGITVAWNRSNLPAATPMTGAGRHHVNQALALLLEAVAA